MELSILTPEERFHGIGGCESEMEQGLGRKWVWRFWDFLSKHCKPQPCKYFLGETDGQELTTVQVSSVLPVQTYRARAFGLGKKSEDESKCLISIFSRTRDHV